MKTVKKDVIQKDMSTNETTLAQNNMYEVCTVFVTMIFMLVSCNKEGDKQYKNIFCFMKQVYMKKVI